MSDETKSAEAEVKAKAAKKAKPEAKDERTAADMLDYLRESGSPWANTDEARNFVHDHAEARPRDLYDFMVQAGVTLGTVRKAGKWAFGDDFEPETDQGPSQKEEVKALREQVARLQAEVDKNAAYLMASRRRVRALEDELERTKGELIGARRADEAQASL